MMYMSTEEHKGTTGLTPAKHEDIQGHVKNLEVQLKAEQEKNTQLLNRMKYLQADFENYKKRIDKELADTKSFISEKLIGNLLDVIDEYELALKVAKEGGNLESLAGGVEMTLKKFLDTLAKEGLSRIDVAGKKFDPNLHEAAEIVPTKEKEEGTIISEIRAGYMLKDKVLRPSMVKVAAPS
ncbi:MAG: nucleotide exchange factor GrpE [Thaumarchaeota archaeon]|nr:nucleotide exchange factor GrpE [Nitrososphaerota archaeon]